MRGIVLGLLVGLAQAAVPDAGLYQRRRATLAETHPDCASVLFAQSDSDVHHLRSSFFQEPNFYYLTGWREPGAILLVTRDRHALFLPERDLAQERWTGPRTSADLEGVEQLTGFRQVGSVTQFETELRAALERVPRLCALRDTPHWDRLAQIQPLREIRDLRASLARMRMTKSDAEIRQIRFAVAVSVNAHRVAWRRLAAGLFEYQFGASLISVFIESGCERPAYAPIVASGPNSTILHYTDNRRRMDSGELALVDAGAECGSYAADITRTVPVNRKFSNRQRELYEIVLGAHKAVLAAVKPGMALDRNAANSLYRIAYDYIDTHGRDKHGEPLGRYFTHAIGHHIGLEVHDPFDVGVALEPGMVITVEPGIYLPEEGIGIRIEDMVLVTDNGAEVLSRGLPLEAAAIERALQR